MSKGFAKGKVMNRKIYRLINLAAVLVLTIGSYYSVQAEASLPSEIQHSTAETWSVTKSYIVDKDNIGGKGCNDAWPGTVDQPLCTVTAGLAVVKAGEGLFLRAGTYPSFTVSKSGTSTSPITIAGYQNEIPKIDGGIGIRLTNVSYVTIRGFEVIHASGNGVLRMGGVVISAGGNNTIEYCIVHDNTTDSPNGIKIEGASNNHILHNTVYNNGGPSGGVGIKVIGGVWYPSATNNEIGWNIIHDHILGGADADGIETMGSVDRSYIHHNLVYANGDDGIDTWDTSHNTIVGNIAYDNTGPGDGNGFKLGGGETGGHNLVLQNVAYGNKLNGFDSNGTGGNVYYNNVAYNNGNFGFEDGWKDPICTPLTCQETFINNIGYNNIRGNFSASMYTAVSHNNLWYSDSGSAKIFYDYTLFSSLSEFYLVSGNRLDNPVAGELASLQSNPEFTNAAGGIFTLQSYSPAIDRGDPANPGLITTANRVDIGAFENEENSLATAMVFTSTSVATLHSTTTPVLPTTTPTAISLPASSTPTTMIQPPSPTATTTSSAVSETMYDDRNSAFVYSPGWQDISDPLAYAGSYKLADKKGVSATLDFNGQSFSILYTSGPSYRGMDIYVDGILIGTINEKTSLIQYQQRWDYPGPLSFGVHTLKLVTNNRNNTYNSFDQVIVR
jgi:parallel beta-helix repeat protein